MKVGDMIRESDPSWTKADTQRAMKCAQRMLETINTWNQDAIRDRLAELRAEDQVFAAVVYTYLPAPIRNFLNETF